MSSKMLGLLDILIASVMISPMNQFTVMPIQIYNWITLPQEDYRVHLAAAGIIVLLAVLLSLNAIAVLLRKKFEIHWS